MPVLHMIMRIERNLRVIRNTSFRVRRFGIHQRLNNEISKLLKGKPENNHRDVDNKDLFPDKLHNDANIYSEKLLCIQNNIIKFMNR